MGEATAMSNQRLLNDTCFAIAKDMVGLVAHLLREEEHQDAFTEFYEAARRRLLVYEVEQERLRQRLYGDRPN
jgi:hypothetical protein